MSKKTRFWIGLLCLATVAATACRSKPEMGHENSSNEEEPKKAVALEQGGPESSASGPAQGLERKEKSLEELSGAVARARAAGDPRELADSLERFGARSAAIGDSETAEESYEEALSIYRQLGVAEGELRCYRWLARLHRISGNVGQALESYRRAYSLAEKLGDPVRQGLAVNGWAVLNDQIGDLGSAVAGFEEALGLFLESNAEAETALASTNLAATLAQLGQSARAMDLLTDAINVYRTLEDREGQVSVWLQVGWLHFLDGELSRAKTALLEAERLLTPEMSPGLRAGIQGRLGTVFLAEQEWERAENQYLAAMKTGRDHGLSSSLAYSLVNLCRWHVISQQALEGEETCDRAVSAAREAGNEGALASAHLWRAHHHRESGVLSMAMRDALSAVSSLEKMGLRVPGRRGRSQYASERSTYFDLVVELSMELGRTGEALAASDRLRGQGLAEALMKIRDPIFGGGHTEARRLLLQMADLQGAARARWALGENGDDVERRLRETYAAYEGLHRPDARLVPQRLEALGSKTVEPSRWLETRSDDPLVIVFGIGERKSFVWTVEKSGVRGHRLKVSISELESLVSGFLRYLSDARGWIHARHRTALGRALFDALLSPISDRMLPERRLIIVPDGSLRSIPFAALPSPSGGSQAGETYLVEDHEIVQAPSLGLLTALGARSKSAARKRIGVIADPVYGPSDPRWPKNRPQTQSREEFARLEGSLREIEAIKNVLGAESGAWATGYEASAAAIREGTLDLSEFAILHFAVHGSLDSERPELSALVLSQYDRFGRPVDGFLRVGDIFFLDLKAQLVVAGACRTGLGGTFRSEALSAFAQAFMAAGASQVLVSHWLVDDQATSMLMTRFYDYLTQEGYRPGAALRRAQRDLLEDPRFRRPYFWAPFVLQGDGSSLRLPGFG